VAKLPNYWDMSDKKKPAPKAGFVVARKNYQHAKEKLPLGGAY
jgi:hypothetical protein